MYWLFYVAFNFVFYSLFGWVLEEVYCFVTRGYFKEDGFLNVPFKPMYGIAICILLILYYKFEVSNITLLILCAIIPTLVEYLSGYMLKEIFNEVYWSYANMKYNFQELICLRFSIYWAVLSFLTVKFFHTYLHKIYIRFSSVCNIIAIVLVIIIALDFFNISVEHIRDRRNKELDSYTYNRMK